MYFFLFSFCCNVTDCFWKFGFDEKQKSCIKHIYLVNDDVLYNWKGLHKKKNYFYFSINPFSSHLNYKMLILIKSSEVASRGPRVQKFTLSSSNILSWSTDQIPNLLACVEENVNSRKFRVTLTALT